ncbi:unnamed protein product [Caenorhabditis angaria]|uniref:Uncharacterized protein n=1 Tax=Caenorhabditis angaria TaxID=860376 RepID=A0A9P1IDD7_9PELO|nr:unnamed protein product [Caenorhabditis angaria]
MEPAVFNEGDFAIPEVQLPPGLPIAANNDMSPPAYIPPRKNSPFFTPTPNKSQNQFTPRKFNNSRSSPRTPRYTNNTNVNHFQLINDSMAIPPLGVDIHGISNESGAVKYPLLLCSQEGTIMISLAVGVLVEICVDRSFRLVSNDNFTTYVNHNGSISSILHKYAKIVHSKEHVHCKINNTNDRYAIMGPEGILFTMANLSEAYLVSHCNAEGTTVPTAVALEKPTFPIQNIDYSLHQLYNESDIGIKNFSKCNEIVQKACYEYRSDGLLVIHLNGMTIKCNNDTGDVSVDAKPVRLEMNSKLLTVTLKSNFIDMSVQDRDKCYVKRSDKRIHTSRSGMVVSDGACTISMDQTGRILSCY